MNTFLPKSSSLRNVVVVAGFLALSLALVGAVSATRIVAGTATPTPVAPHENGHSWHLEYTYDGGQFPGGGFGPGGPGGGSTIQVPGSPLELTIEATPEDIHPYPQHSVQVTVTIVNTNVASADPDDPANDPVPIPSRSVGAVEIFTLSSSNISGTSELGPGESLTDTFNFDAPPEPGGGMLAYECGDVLTAELNYAEIAGKTVGVRYVCDEDYNPLREVPPPTCDSQGSDAPGTNPSPPNPVLGMGGGESPAGGGSVDKCCKTATLMRGAPATKSLAGKFWGTSMLTAGMTWQGAGSSGSQMHLLSGIRFLPHRNTIPSSLGLGLFLPYDKSLLLFQDDPASDFFEFQIFDPDLGFPVFGEIDAIDGLFIDEPVYADAMVLDEDELPTSDITEAKYFIVVQHDGSRLKFESPLMSGEFRYVGTIDKNDMQMMTVTYVDDFSHKIASVTDMYDGQVDFGYDGTVAGGVEVITSITFPGEAALPVTYDGEVVHEINLPENTKYEFIVEVPTGSVNGTVEVTIKSPFEGDRKYELSSDYRIVDPNFIIVQPSGYIKKVYDAEGEIEWAIFFSPLKSGLMRILENGGAKLTEIEYAKSRTSFSSFTVGNLNQGFNAFTDLVVDTVDSVDYGFTFGDYSLFNTPNSASDSNGENYQYEYDDEMFVTKKTYVDDATFEEWEYDDRKNVTRYRNRLGNITKNVYDANGNVLERQVGIKDIVGVDTEMPEYGVYKFDYFSDGMLKTEFMPQWTNETDIYRTDYVYNATGSLEKKIGPASAVGEARPETNYSYNAARLLHTMTDPVGRVTTNEYDDLNRLIRVEYNDGSDEKFVYGASLAGNQMLFSIDRNGIATSFEYDMEGRKIKEVAGFGVDDGAGGITPTTEAWNQSVKEFSYVPGTESVATKIVDGAMTSYIYDHKIRLVEIQTRPRRTSVLSEKTFYEGDRIFCKEDRYGRKTYFGYSVSSPDQPIRKVQGNHPGFSLATYGDVIGLVRDLSSNAPFIIHDTIRDAEGKVTDLIDGRGITSKHEYDSRERKIRETKAFGSAIEAITEMDYDPSMTISSRSGCHATSMPAMSKGTILPNIPSPTMGEDCKQQRRLR